MTGRDAVSAERCVVNNRVFLLGLDSLYREAIKPHERGELLGCARVVSAKLGAAPFGGPVEGYYTEDEALTEYFRLLRALQQISGTKRSSVARLREFKRLLEVTSSPVYGRAIDSGRLLPTGRDPLSEALRLNRDEWSLVRLLDTAYRAADESDDCSLVGLAALARDPVVLTALRESAVLYAERVRTLGFRALGCEYVWEVGEDVARRAAHFVEAFNRLFGEHLPEPIPQNAETFWHARGWNTVKGRCVALGVTPPPERYYHWAICSTPEGQPAVQEFWADELWTTERYREGLMWGGRPPVG